jgi:hypothetical protein
MRLPLAVLGLMLAPGLFAADQMREITRMHIEVLGGRPAIEALASIRVSGVLFLEEKRLKFTLTQARPNRLRLEGNDQGHKFTQAYDGEELPWQLNNQDWPLRSRTVSEPSATRLMADAEYDGPIVSSKDRGFIVNHVGEVERDGRKFLHLRVTWRLLETYSLLLDPETYLITYRIDSRAKNSEQNEETITFYGDYRPVDSVLIPHDIITAVDGRITERMRIDKVEANPRLGAEVFARPDRGSEPPADR